MSDAFPSSRATRQKKYWMVRVDITDQERYRVYIAANAESLHRLCQEKEPL
jgi:uncharacterized protein (DUF1330 family)